MSKCPALYYSWSSRSEQHISKVLQALGAPGVTQGNATVSPRQSGEHPRHQLVSIPGFLKPDHPTALSKEGFPLPRLQAPWSRAVCHPAPRALSHCGWQKACHVGPTSHHCSDGFVTVVGSSEHRARKAFLILSRMNFFPDTWGMVTEFFSYQTIS